MGDAVKISASVMAHPDRETQVNDLTMRLDRVVPVFWDTEGPSSGNGDRVWRTARGAWSLADPEADWHVLLQDDAWPCEDFLAGLERALAYVPPDAVVSPYLGTGRNVPIRWEAMARAADTAGATWVRSTKLMWGVCIVLPVSSISSMVAYANRKSAAPDDMRVAGWAEKNGREVWYTWPSLADHLPVASLTKHKARERVARNHLQGSALDINWTGKAVTDPMLTRRNPARSGPSRVRSGLEQRGRKSA
jgi:hypothetical protein